ARGKGTEQDVPLLVEIASNIMGNTVCAFGEGMSMPILGILLKFSGEFIEAAKNGVPGSPLGDSTRDLVLGSVA
ncbi:MAG: NADH-ubiquinone oxidoreductase-F iron-sulfur binding region domain-containing protein, partial [Planctomycetota bacterium]